MFIIGLDSTYNREIIYIYTTSRWLFFSPEEFLANVLKRLGILERRVTNNEQGVQPLVNNYIKGV